MCDDHPDRKAYKRIQGETDSFGAELFDVCEECYKEYEEELKAADNSGCCDWCKNHAARLFDRRDFEEGMSGPVYRVCGPCVDRQMAALHDYASDDFDEDYDSLYEDD